MSESIDQRRRRFLGSAALGLAAAQAGWLAPALAAPWEGRKSAAFAVPSAAAMSMSCLPMAEPPCCAPQDTAPGGRDKRRGAAAVQDIGSPRRLQSLRPAAGIVLAPTCSALPAP